ncbi:myb-like DNA-binding protein [Mucor ambiguus]|uniref:Myb-like DNA-binding protein n=1 Tax=Mucor ambiguus TaxID=91626 RepID=A0A0C9N120_9FUNG|nr:myb-like DNA-binding protein [Mucor ambiguus]
MLAAFARNYTSSYLSGLRSVSILYQSLSFRHFASQQTSKWLPWEDTLLQNYVKHNGKNWNEVAEHCLPTRTPNQCRARWTDALDPELKHGPFSKAEKELLQQGVETLGKGKWLAIRRDFLPHRSSRRIANEWSNRPSLMATGDKLKSYTSKKWTAQEDELVLRGIAEFGQSSWAKIASVYLPWRTRIQIRNHYRSKLDPSVKKEKWTEHELDLLLRRTIMFGQDWNKVAEGIRGRTPEQCSRVWLTELDPGMNKGPWSDEETKLFWERVHQCDGNFVKIAEGLPGRNRLICYRKFWSTVRDDKEFALLYGDQIKRDKTENGPAWRARVGKLVCEWLESEYTVRKASNHSINLCQRGPWSKEELSKLELIVSKQLEKKEALDQGDWRKIAKQLPERDAQQCKYQYEEHLFIEDLKTGTWTEQEDSLLTALVAEHGTSSWERVVQNIPKRSKRQCAYRWHRVLQFTQGQTQIPKNKRLSDAEKALIREGVEMFGHDWTAIRMTYLPDRKPEQIMRWWNSHEEGQDHRERKAWTEEEDKTLEFAVSKYEGELGHVPSWAQVAKMVQGRSSKQCRTRWLYSLQPNLIKGAWTYDEEMQLLEVVQKYKLQDTKSGKSIWPLVAKDLNTGRSDWACRSKYDYMQRKGHRFAF